MTLSLYRNRFLISWAIVLLLALAPAFAVADAPTSGSGGGVPTSGSGGLFPTSGSGGIPTSGSGGQASCNGGACSIQNPLNVTSVCGLLKNVLQGAVAIGIPVAVLFIIWSGFQFVLAQGNPKKLGAARKNFFYTIIGIAVFVGAWVLAMLIAATVNAIGGSNILSCN